jgi:hypothetical protein
MAANVTAVRVLPVAVTREKSLSRDTLAASRMAQHGDFFSREEADGAVLSVVTVLDADDDADEEEGTGKPLLPTRKKDATAL